METDDHGASPAGGVFLCGLWESSGPFPLSVGPWLLELDRLLRQEGPLAVWGSARHGEGVGATDSGEEAAECSGLAWRAGRTWFIFSEEDPP